MGICSSNDSTGVATTKLILHDGKLEEFTYPVKVSYVLQKYPSCFICNSDEMDFGELVSPINGDQELQLGQLYFALPLTRLKTPFQPQDFAALAVKASSALMKNGYGSGGAAGGGGSGREKLFMFSSSELIKPHSNGGYTAARTTSVKKKDRRRENGGGGGGGGGRRRSRDYTSDLSAITE